MLNWALIFFGVAIVAAILGFSGISAGATLVAKVLCFLFAAMFVVFFVHRLAERRRLRARIEVRPGQASREKIHR